MRISGRQRALVGGAKIAAALVLVSSAIGAAPTPVRHPAAKHHTARVHVVSLVGTAAPDVLRGGRGNDWIQGRGGVDRLYGGDGNDALDAVDGVRDYVSCGAGYDQVTADRADVVAHDCEAIIRRDS
jgi:hypothetical protein